MFLLQVTQTIIAGWLRGEHPGVDPFGFDSYHNGPWCGRPRQAIANDDLNLMNCYCELFLVELKEMHVRLPWKSVEVQMAVHDLPRWHTYNLASSLSIINGQKRT
jgi:hypothetical protein